MPKALRDGQTPKPVAMASQAEGSDAFGPPKPSSLRELAKRGRRFRGKKSLQDAFAEALNDLFDAYLYTLYHPCDISPHELIALINAHREVMEVQRDIQWRETAREVWGKHKRQSAI
jgi:hypothetical protein